MRLLFADQTKNTQNEGAENDKSMNTSVPRPICRSRALKMSVPMIKCNAVTINSSII